MSAFTLYLIFLLAKVSAIIYASLIIPLIAIVLTIGWYIIRRDDLDKELDKNSDLIKNLDDLTAKRCVKATCLFSILLIITFFMPSKNEVILLYVVPKVTKSKAYKDLPPLVMKYITKQLNDEK